MQIKATPRAMRAWVVPSERGTRPRLRSVSRDVPRPGAGDVLLRIVVCGVCRTDLHLADHDLVPRRPHTVPGHEVVGTVVERGPGAERFEVGERVGVAWLRGTCGRCRMCRFGRENLCRDATFTGWDADGGFAEYAVAPEAFGYRLPDVFPDVEAAPLLCSGIIGYRALQRATRSRCRASGSLRLRCQRPPDRPAGHRPRDRGPRAHPRRRCASPGARARCRLCRGCTRNAASRSGRRHSLRTGGRPGPRGDGGPGPGWDAWRWRAFTSRTSRPSTTSVTCSASAR